MKNLPELVRDKAIEIANALLMEENMGEGLAIAIAIKQAKQWALRHYGSSTTGNKHTDIFLDAF